VVIATNLSTSGELLSKITDNSGYNNFRHGFEKHNVRLSLLLLHPTGAHFSWGSLFAERKPRIAVDTAKGTLTSRGRIVLWN